MKGFLLLSAAAVAVAASLSPFPPEPEGVKVLRSKIHENVTISYKEPGICETTPGVRSYAGHVHLPPGFLDDVDGEPQDYPINTFFWFFEARKDPANAPLAVWLNGGPGASSLMGLLQENGPCMVLEDSQTTKLNPWSWNNEVNMLYIDEPNQVGFSYDVPTNVTVRLFGGGGGGPGEEEEQEAIVVIPTDFSDEWPELNLTTRAGTLSSQKQSHTANSTAQAAHALWHFAQTFFFEFPHYKPNDDRISLWGESYGGHYGPGFLRFFQQQNDKIANGTIDDETAQYIHLDTLGIVNGYVDAVIQEETAIDFAYNNTYGLQIFNQSLHDQLMHNFTRPGGCREQMLTCQEKLSSSRTPNLHITEVCDIDAWCTWGAEGTYMRLGRAGWFDIAHDKHDAFPPPHINGYLTQPSVLSALGSPVNFSATSAAVGAGFGLTRDDVHGGFVDALAHLLDEGGVKVHMMYGDRDYACNWVGGERVSLAVPYARAKDFAAAGYAALMPDGGGGGGGPVGVVRQLGNFSFTRIFQAGHMVPAYQPAAAYSVFMRATFNRDLPTGLLPVSDDLATVGPSSSWHIKNTPPESPKPRCYILSPETCTPDVWAKVAAGHVRVKDWFVVEDDDDDEEVGEL